MGRQKKYPMPNGAVYSDVKSDDQRRKVRIKFSNQTEVNLFLIGPNKMVLRLANM